MKCVNCGKPSQQGLCHECFVPVFQDLPDRFSYAFTEEMPDISQIQSAKVLDFFRTPISSVSFKSFKQLTHIRLSSCGSLEEFHLIDNPSLVVLDLSNCPQLTVLEIKNCNALKAVDLSFCLRLTDFNAELNNCMYLSITSTQISKLPELPSIKYLDISTTPIADISQLFNSQNLQILIINQMCKLTTNLAPLTSLPNLATIQMDSNRKVKLDFSNSDPDTKLKQIWAMGSDIVSAPELKPPARTFINFKYQEQLFSKPVQSGDWVTASRLLYGPWPTPPNDAKPLANPDVVFQCPAQDLKRAAYHIAGTFFGNAMGDCLGLHVEGQDPIFINFMLETPPDIVWTHPRVTQRGSFYPRGSFTDDTALSLMFARSVAKLNGEVNELDLGARVRNWIFNGLDEHLDGQGIGRGQSTSAVVGMDDYLLHPIQCSQQFYKYNPTKSGNGGVMRTGAVGCFKFWDEEAVINNATKFCQVTHFNPSCVYSSVVVSLLISRIIQWRLGMRGPVDVDEICELCLQRVEGLLPEDINAIKAITSVRRIEDLSEANCYSMSLLTMGYGIIVFRMGCHYKEGIEAVIRSGGDTDTNAAVAGAVLGAYWGFGDIPVEIVQYFWYGGSVYRDLVPYLKLMGLEFPPPTLEEWKQYEY